MQKSIEVEYWVIDRDGELTTPDSLADVSEYVEEEFVGPLFELKTPPCETFEDLRSTFVELLEAVVDRSDELGKSLVPLGTPINSDPIEPWPDARSRIQKQVIGPNFEYANYCAGTHLHFEKRNVTDQLNVLAGIDPALAVLNSSPFFQGKRVASSARAYLYRKLCYEDFPKHGQLWSYVETVAQWERRLERCFEEFREEAVEAGIDGDDVDDHFSPDSVVWTPVRLRDEMPTVEWRAPDTALPSHVLRLAEEVDAIMERMHHANVRVAGNTGGVAEDEIVLPEFETVRDLSDRAILSGISSDRVERYLDRMGFDVRGYDPISQRIDGREIVSLEEAKRLRCRYADTLKRDVRTLARS